MPEIDMMNQELSIKVDLVGDVNHADFRDVMELLRAEAIVENSTHVSPELIVIAQSRPGTIALESVLSLRRRAPLAGVIGLLGSWCEGESRTGRPWPGVERLYWYEFPAWWRRQMALRAAGRCPDWSRPANVGIRIADGGLRREPKGAGLIVLRSPHCETAHVLADVFRCAGYATAWHRAYCFLPVIHGATAGIWGGGQLNDREASDLAAFCRQLSRDGAPVIAILDFPRRDRVERALEVGAAAVLGMPWHNADLLMALQTVRRRKEIRRAA
jgi:hypothetical protein